MHLESVRKILCPKGIEGSDTSYSANEILFLEDVQDYPESGIAARYKRIGLGHSH
jgi:hypothetical protein